MFRQIKGTISLYSPGQPNMAEPPPQQCFRIRDLPDELILTIIKKLPSDSQVCLALSSHESHDLVVSALGKPLGDICPSTWKCDCKGWGWTYILAKPHPHNDFFGLMKRLRDWMPGDLTFCYFCHKYMEHKCCPLVDNREVKAVPERPIGCF